VDWCQKEEPNDHLAFVQIKHVEGLTLIYCPLSVIEIQGKKRVCPNLPFLVPDKTSFKLNGVEFVMTTTHLAVKGSFANMMKANWDLSPKVNFTALRESSLHFRDMKEGAWSVTSWIWLMTLGILTTTILICGCVTQHWCHLRRQSRQPIKGTVIHGNLNAGAHRIIDEAAL